MTRARSGRSADTISLDAVRSGEISLDDVRIHPETLLHQAAVARTHGNPQLAANLERAAELAMIDDARVMEIYDALRPRRSTADELEAIALELDRAGASLTAALVREARAAYAARGLLA